MVRTLTPDIFNIIICMCKSLCVTNTWICWVLSCLSSFFMCAHSSVQFSLSVMSDFLWPHGLQHARVPYSSPTPRAYSNSCPLSRWCNPMISSSVIPFSPHLQSFPASGSFLFFFLSFFFFYGIHTFMKIILQDSQGKMFAHWWEGEKCRLWS